MGTPVTLETALHLRNHRLSIIPTRPDGTKAPALPWKAYQTDRPRTAGRNQRMVPGRQPA